jgi:hypothetical protein
MNLLWWLVLTLVDPDPDPTPESLSPMAESAESISVVLTRLYMIQSQQHYHHRFLAYKHDSLIK